MVSSANANWIPIVSLPSSVYDVNEVVSPGGVEEKKWIHLRHLPF